MNKHDKSFLHGSNTAFIEALFKAYSRDPTSVEPSWRAYFDEISGTEAKVSKSNGVKLTGVNVAPLLSGAGPEPELRSVPAEAVMFLVRIKECIEAPERLLLEL